MIYWKLILAYRLCNYEISPQDSHFEIIQTTYCWPDKIHVVRDFCTSRWCELPTVKSSKVVMVLSGSARLLQKQLTILRIKLHCPRGGELRMRVMVAFIRSLCLFRDKAKIRRTIQFNMTLNVPVER